MKKRKLWKAMSAALSAVLLATSVPSAAFAAVPAKTADVQTKAADENELKLWYDEKAPDSYDGWEKWSLPLGNSGSCSLEAVSSLILPEIYSCPACRTNERYS